MDAVRAVVDQRRSGCAAGGNRIAALRGLIFPGSNWMRQENGRSVYSVSSQPLSQAIGGKLFRRISPEPDWIRKLLRLKL